MPDSFHKTFAEIAVNYIDYLSVGDLNELLSLFASDAEVLSPLYGRQSAKAFYSRLFADTNDSVLELKDVLSNPKRSSGCIYFSYSWTLASGETVNFDVVDYVQLGPDGKITFLQIIYDTIQSRPALTRVQNKAKEE